VIGKFAVINFSAGHVLMNVVCVDIFQHICKSVSQSAIDIFVVCLSLEFHLLVIKYNIFFVGIRRMKLW
jgi:hypothetical protein